MLPSDEEQIQQLLSVLLKSLKSGITAASQEPASPNKLASVSSGTKQHLLELQMMTVHHALSQSYLGSYKLKKKVFEGRSVRAMINSSKSENYRIFK